MKKAKFVKRYGIETYEKRLQQIREWRETNREKLREHGRGQHRKGGELYEHYRKYQSTGLPHERQLVRKKHGRRYRPFKKIIAPESQIHHEWIPSTSNFRGVALVEKDQHQHGFIDVIQILEGEITLFTEEKIRMK